MLLGLLGAFGAAICYGIGSVLQAMGARRTHAAEGLDPVCCCAWSAPGRT